MAVACGSIKCLAALSAIFCRYRCFGLNFCFVGGECMLMSFNVYSYGENNRMDFDSYMLILTTSL